MLNSYDYGSEYSLPGLEVADQCFNLLEAAREELCRGNVEDALAFVQIIHDEGDYFLIALETMYVHLEDATETHRELLNGLTDEKAELATDEMRYQESIAGHLDDIQHADWQKEHLQYLKHEAEEKHGRAELAYEENKNERETVRGWYFIPIVGWIGWGVKNSSCNAKMAKEKEVMDEARKQATDAELSRDVVDALLEEDQGKLLDAREKLQKCEIKVAEHHNLIGDLKKVLSVVIRAKKAVEEIKDLADRASGNVETLKQILGICLTRPAVGRSSGTAVQFEHTAKSWSEVKDIIRANGSLLNHPNLYNDVRVALQC